MRIESIRISGFGCLGEREYEFPADRAVLVLENNESGKSTLAAALLAGLCGFPNRRRGGEIMKLAEVYRPWDNDNYGLRMVLQAAGKRYVVERDFARDRFVIRDAATHRDVSAEFDPDLAYSFLRLYRDDFERIAFISGKQVQQFSSSPNIRARLAAVVDGSNEEPGADGAIALLESVTYPLGGRNIKPETALSRLSADFERVRREMAALDESLEAAGDDVRLLDEARERHARMLETLSNLDAQYRAARLEEVNSRIMSAKRNIEEVEALRKEMADLQQWAQFPIERSEQLSRAVTRLGERKNSLAELVERRARLQRQADELKMQLESAAQFEAASDDDLVQLRSCESEIHNAQAALERKHAEVEQEKRALQAEGLDLDALLRASGRLETLSPQDREFARSYQETIAKLNADEQCARAELAQAASSLALINQRRAQAALSGRLISLAGLTAIALGLVLWLSGALGPETAIAGAVVGAVGAAVGLVRSIAAASSDADAKARLEQEQNLANQRIQDAGKSLKDVTERMERIAAGCGMESVPALVDALCNREKALSRSGVMNSLTGQLAQAQESLTSARDRAVRRLAALGRRCSEDEDVIEAILSTARVLSDYLSRKTKLQELGIDSAAVEREIAEKQAAVDEESAIVSSVLADAGIDASQPLEQALSQFNEREFAYRRYRQIKDTLLPAAESHLVPQQELERLKQEQSELMAQSVEATSREMSSSEIEARRQSARDELQAVSDEVRTLERSIGTKVDRYRSEYPLLQDELQRLEREYRKAHRFSEAVGKAGAVLRQVSEDSHRRWAAALNERAGRILPHLNPDYEDIRFDDSLAFALRRKSDGRIIEQPEVDARLSTGAKDQIYLAVRLACCGEISRLGEALPVVLDDPLMASDDDRFRRGLEYIITTLAKETQVIILSCHKSRHEDLLREDWFANNVDILELKSEMCQ